jgi:cellulose synthase/poly-beta-1,6-N-acetylglucosamine synthase-like glycosyltransferase
MEHFSTIVFYVFSFLSVYVQVFFLITFFEKRKSILIRKDAIELSEYPEVTVIVPCYNEERTIEKTVRSLLALDYPNDKLNLILIDDGSQDSTWEVIKSFEALGNVRTFKKENGGKYTALNLGLKHTKTPYVGCLDADSFVHPQALKRIISYFLADEETMAVCPSIIVHDPKNILQKAQKAEYDMAIYTKKMLGFMGGIHVTPGPFSIFRTKVFDNIGPYERFHGTEDQGVALKMQAHGLKIDHCPDAYVYTVSPNTIPKLYRQRLRWIYGFIKNAVDFRFLLFKKKYGNIAFFTLPSGFVSVASIIFLLLFFGNRVFAFASDKLLALRTVGLGSMSHVHLDWFFVNIQAISFISIILYSLVISALVLGRRMSGMKNPLSLDIVYFILVYTILAPFWMTRAIYNSIWSKESNWAGERKVATTKS